MSDSQSEDETTTIRRIIVNAAPPKAAHYLTWTRVGTQILLEVGYFDLVSIQQVMARTGDEPESRTVDWLVTDRFILDIESGQRFAHAAAALGDEITRFLAAEGRVSE